VAHYGVDAVALNDRFRVPPALDYWSPTHAWFAAARARLDGAPAAFERLYDGGDFVLYRVHRDALDTLSTPAPPRPYVLELADRGGPPATTPGEAPLPSLWAFALARHEAVPGDTVSAEAWWRGSSAPRLPPGSYIVAVRLDRDAPLARVPAFVAKPVRKVIERLRGERYRLRADHLPVGGEYGVDLWRGDQLVRDRFDFVVPRDAAAGEYTVRVRMLVQPHYPNYRLSDYFFEDDYYSGRPVGTLRITRTPRPAGGGG
jgi:hypothetical protein